MKARIVAVVLIGVTLGLKLHGNYAVPPAEVYAALSQAAVSMQAQGWQVSTQLVGLGKLQAQRGNCQITARILDPHGTNDAFLTAQLTPLGRVRYAWDGAWHDSLPRFAPLMSYYFTRELARQGLAASRRGVWIAAVGPSCPGDVDAGFSSVRIAFAAR